MSKWFLLVNQQMGGRTVPIELTDAQAQALNGMCEGGSTDKRSWSLQCEDWVKGQALAPNEVNRW